MRAVFCKLLLKCPVSMSEIYSSLYYTDNYDNTNFISHIDIPAINFKLKINSISSVNVELIKIRTSNDGGSIRIWLQDNRGENTYIYEYDRYGNRNIVRNNSSYPIIENVEAASFWEGSIGERSECTFLAGGVRKFVTEKIYNTILSLLGVDIPVIENNYLSIISSTLNSQTLLVSQSNFYSPVVGVNYSKFLILKNVGERDVTSQETIEVNVSGYYSIKITNFNILYGNNVYNLNDYFSDSLSNSVYVNIEDPQLVEIRFYNNNAENIILDKTNYLSSEFITWGVFRESVDVLNPTITLELYNFPTFNYVYIPKFNRYYYITDITCISKNLYDISCDVDVLMSYKDIILQQEGLIGRNEFEFNFSISDNILPVLVKKEVLVKASTDMSDIFVNTPSLDTWCCILNCINGNVRRDEN